MFWPIIKKIARNRTEFPWRQQKIRLFEDIKEKKIRDNLIDYFKKCAAGRPFIHREENTLYADVVIPNLNIARCFNCKDISIWIYDKLFWPLTGTTPLPNPDSPADIREDYNEASSILNLSPRGSAALLRLSIQKLCKHVGEKGNNINEDIKELVKKGLDQRIQKALDIVRVVGNEAVHPGTLDFRDDRTIAEMLFNLVNLISEKMISEKNILTIFSIKY